ncbi:M23 family metallopeptidase [Flaviaesturariibacter aridisoli]|uniref:M23 family metallopeptidase n=1 Tax=Flaviaesturariibacter aridisoli TaxID=2545761 RepID=A0A4R4E1P6_9BACT|nr:M23 family metallopeptidase [Flaviaesturariibacter aridisoli]TCZ73356.1 M23 family metallopeptidase [Flaviaesturariibacter aridisoli]
MRKTLLPLLALFAIAAISLSFTTRPGKKSTARRSSVSRSLVFPVAGGSRIRDKWGASRGGGIRRHKGIDIHARKGTPVVALADGIITERARMPVGGKTLWLKPAGQPWTAYYAHLDKQLVREGQHVRKGQVIGTVGNTGNARSTPPHLHFGVKQSGHWVNPLPYVNGSPKLSASKAPRAKVQSTLKKKKARSRR